MKGITLLMLSFIAVSTVGDLHAQSVKATKVTSGMSAEGNSVTYNLPQTVLKINITAQRESIRKGPYARFAQKYLGVVAPLSDKDIFTITSATIIPFEESNPAEIYLLDNPDKSPLKIFTPKGDGLRAVTPDGMPIIEDRFGEAQFTDLGIAGLIDKRTVTTMSNVASDTGFVKIPVDKIEVFERTPEEMAAEAANTIFTLRKRRFDLVTGEAGENVFGAGLQAALVEMKRIEEEYVALFLGKTSVSDVTATYDVVPDKAKNSMIVCRFADNKGLVPDNDLSGRPIVLELTPEKRTQNHNVVRKSKDPRGVIFYPIPDIVKCRLIDGKSVIATDRLPIYQLGTIIEIPVTSIK